MAIDDHLSTCHHEAGHAWVYWLHRLPLRYVTVRPRGAGLVGICRPWKPRPINAATAAMIAAAGPIAQAIYDQGADPDAEMYEWGDFMFAAYIGGGHGDFEGSMGLLDRNTEGLREWVLVGWPGILAVADALAARGTVPGSEVFAMFTDTLGAIGRGLR